MGQNNSTTFSSISDKNICEEEFQIIKNDIVYNIKLIFEKKDDAQKLKLSVSFVSNNSYQIYEDYITQIPEIEKIENYEQVFQKLIELIKAEKFEIIHENNENNNDQFILFKTNYNDKEINFKLISSLADGKTKFDELIKNYNNLEKNYIKLKKGQKNNYHLFDYPLDIDQDEQNDSVGNDDNINNENNIDNNTAYESSDEKHIALDTYSSIWCMLKLNKIFYLENNETLNLNLVALGFSNGKIIIIDIDNMKIYQELRAPNTVYSLAQFNDDSKYLICSLSNGQMIIYILKDNKYEEFQILQKPPENRKGEINKVITLSDGNLASADRGSVAIWKPKIEEGEKKYEFFKELETDGDTCQLLEVNPQIFACAIYRSRLIKIYKNDGNEYQLLGNINNVESHGTNSNGMTKINDNLFCSGGKGSFYIVSVEPMQVIQKIMLIENSFRTVQFLHCVNEKFIFTAFGHGIAQYKIIKDVNNNFIKLELFSTITDVQDDSDIALTEDGKIFYCQRLENNNQKINFFLTKYQKEE